MSTLYTLLIIIAIIALALIALYNRLVRMNVQTQEAWADIDVQLKRRYDLIPNLIETVKGYAKHEQETLQAVLEARSKATSMNIDIKNATPAQMQELAGAQEGIVGALGKLFAVAEAYPDLKANENFLELQRELTDTENKIQSARRFFNSTVRDFKTAMQTFPTSMFVSTFGFKDRDFYELPLESQEREPVAVDFS